MNSTDAHRTLCRVSKTQSGEIFTCMRSTESAPAGTRVAVKRMLLPMKTPREHHGRQRDNPLQEQRVAALLTDQPGGVGHPNIVRYYESFADCSRLFLVMEYCPDGDLHTHMQSLPSKRVPEPQALRFFREIASGVRFLHQLGIAHRDLSLENVLLHNGVCKLADFGLSTDADRVCTELVGKAYYMAPEIVAGERYDPKQADVWSLGVLLFTMLTGSPLVMIASRDDRGLKAVERHGVEAILVAWDMLSLVSMGTVRLLTGMLQVDPRKRISLDAALELPILNR